MTSPAISKPHTSTLPIVSLLSAAVFPMGVLIALSTVFHPTTHLSVPLAYASQLPSPVLALESHDDELTKPQIAQAPPSPTEELAPTTSGIIAAPLTETPISATKVSTTSNAKHGTVILKIGSKSTWVDAKLASSEYVALSPQSNRDNAVIFIKRREEGKGFEIASLSPLTEDLQVDWYITDQSL